MICSDYLDRALDVKSLKKIVKKLAKKALSVKKELKFNGLVGTGVSSLLVLAPLALELKMPFAVVRKKKDNSHSGCSVEGEDKITKYLIVDDFVDTGETLIRIYKEMHLFNDSVPVGAIFYDYYDPEKSFKDFYDYDNFGRRATGDMKKFLELDIPFFTVRAS